MHVDYLLAKETLAKWAHLNLDQRAVMFHRQFPDLKISASTIERYYAAGQVWYKFINRVKKVIDFSTEYYGNMFRGMYDLLKKAFEWNEKVIYLDEAVFSFNTMRNRAWSASYSSIEVYDAKVRMKAQAIVAAISED